MEIDILKRIIWLHFENKSTPAQTQILENWLKTAENQELYFEILHEWEKSNPQVLPNQRGDWEVLSKRMFEDAGPNKSNEKLATRTIRFRNIWLVAASVFFVIGIGYWQREYVLYQTYFSKIGQRKSITLSDNSKVILYGNSQLTFERFSFLTGKRRATLKGVAQFSVVHTKNHTPFTVTTEDQLEVQVLGTEFMVNTRSAKSKVTLTKGKIRLRSLLNNKPSLNVRPGETVSTNVSGEMEVKQNKIENENAASLEMGEFQFNKTPLSEIAIQLNEIYGVKLIISDSSISTKRISGTYPALDLDGTLDMISKILQVNYLKLGQGNILITNQSNIL